MFPTQESNLRLLLGRRILYHWATWEAYTGETHQYTKETHLHYIGLDVHQLFLERYMRKSNHIWFRGGKMKNWGYFFYTVLNCLHFLIECICYSFKRDWNNFLKKNSWSDSFFLTLQKSDSYNHWVLWAELFAFQIHKLTSQPPVPQHEISWTLEVESFKR